MKYDRKHEKFIKELTELKDIAIVNLKAARDSRITYGKYKLVALYKGIIQGLSVAEDVWKELD